MFCFYSLSPVVVPYVGGARGHFLVEPRTGHSSLGRIRQGGGEGEEPSDGVSVLPPPKGKQIEKQLLDSIFMTLYGQSRFESSF